MTSTRSEWRSRRGDPPERPQVVVITGASSGIGHATALAFARRGASVVLISRSATALEHVAEEVRAAGGQALPVAADVARWEDVDDAARQAVSRFGGIDVWINNAAVAEWSLIEEMTPASLRRIIEVNLLGGMYGVRAALPHLRRSPHGIVINVASALADRAIPLLSAYCASKAALKSFSDSLRMELRATGANIDVVTILPSSINTPFYRWGPSKIGVRPHPVSIIYPPQAVVDAIVSAVDRPQREIFVGVMAKLLSVAERLSPPAVDWFMLAGRYMFREQYSSTRDGGQSNLFESPNETDVEGPFTEEMRRGSFYTEVVELRPGLRRGIALAIGGLLLAWGLRRSARSRVRKPAR